MKRISIAALSFLILLLLAGHPAFTQTLTRVSGSVLTAEELLPLPGVEVKILESGRGTVTDSAGQYLLEMPSGMNTLEFSYLGYSTHFHSVRITEGKSHSIDPVYLQVSPIELEEVSVISAYISDRRTPVAVTTLSARTIERQTGNNDYPELLNMTPGIYATRQGGGSGDNRLTMRGFQQENVALLLNGVPVNSMENGLIYWSNWMGLTDATQAIQVQRGLGASKAAMNSVGGTINIITKSTEASRGGSVRFSHADYGNRKTILQLSTGKLKSGWAVTMLGSRTSGPGYVDGTYVDDWAYFLTAGKEFSDRHKLVLTVMGAPDRHGQRNNGMTKAEHKQFGIRFNPDWGVWNGKVLNLSENFYHKPQINLNHYWNINPRTFLATSAYVSFGYGGGRYSEAFNYGPSSWYFRKNNQVDFDAIYLNNVTNTDSTRLADGTWIRGYSRNILTHYRANHYWAGVLSSLQYKVNEHLRFTAGIHLRTFRSRLYEEINDLMGGQYWIDNYAWTLAGVAGRQQVKRVGDVINVDNYSLMNYGSAFGQAEYNRGKWSLFAASTCSGTKYLRKDPYNYITDISSEQVMKAGFDVKAGAGYAIDSYQQVYVNSGYYSREPLFKFIFVNYSNAVALNLANEKIAAVEAGYTCSGKNATVRVNAYLTSWKDRSMLSRENIQLSDSSLTRSLVSGMDALHKGVEVEASFHINKQIRASASVSLGDWKWTNDVSAGIYDDNHVLIEDLEVYAKGLKVGDAPQTQLGLALDYSFFQGYNLVVNWMYYDRLYANFDPVNRADPDDRVQPFRLPAYSITDVSLGYDFAAGHYPASLQLSCQNLFNTVTMLRGDDGPDHTGDTFRGFWTLGRNFNVSLKLSF